ncbi:arsenate reductase (glutaredoxin) [Flavobacteriaceae bacterium UJ101]|nr:arsenate reductase (glutaredoxin) [Flavobacteriaceae bacterium UJ101]
MLFKKINQNIESFNENFDSISKDRKEKLNTLTQYIQEKLDQNQLPKLIVICTHNSRRSHLGQLWLAAGADYYGLQIETYSGGTEATAFHPNAIKAMQNLGFEILTENKENSNPTYQIKWKEDQLPYHAFSKRFEDTPNPTEKFSAIMVCSEADEGCPFVPGTDFRIALPFDDPKAFDNTELESDKYIERARQIGTEMMYVLYNVTKKS